MTIPTILATLEMRCEMEIPDKWYQAYVEGIHAIKGRGWSMKQIGEMVEGVRSDPKFWDMVDSRFIGPYIQARK